MKHSEFVYIFFFSFFLFPLLFLFTCRHSSFDSSQPSNKASYISFAP